MTTNEYKTFSDLFDDDIRSAVLPESAIARRTVHGGCYGGELDRQIDVLKTALNNL